MKRILFLVPLAILLQGCATLQGGHHPATTGTRPASQQSPAASTSAAPADAGGWEVLCQEEAGHVRKQCRAQVPGKVLQYFGDETARPMPILWVSWLQGEDPDKRTICVLGHDYPVNAVQFQVDDQPSLSLTAATASGCFLSSQTFINQLRRGRQLQVTFLRFPWGQTVLGFDLRGSSQSLDLLKQRIKAQ